jgi:hypothetical protein
MCPTDLFYCSQLFPRNCFSSGRTSCTSYTKVTISSIGSHIKGSTDIKSCRTKVTKFGGKYVPGHISRFLLGLGFTCVLLDGTHAKAPRRAKGLIFSLFLGCTAAYSTFNLQKSAESPCLHLAILQFYIFILAFS